MSISCSSRLIFRAVTLTLALLLSSAPVVNAAEAAATSGETQPSTDSAEKAGKSQDSTESKESRTADGSATRSEVFIPTEEISEDFAVSFPVDI